MSFLRKHNVFSHKENMHEARIKLTYATKGKKEEENQKVLWIFTVLHIFSVIRYQVDIGL